MTAARILPLGESALTIRLGEVATVELSEQSAALAEAIRAAGFAGVTDVVAAVASVAVYYDGESGGAGERERFESFIAQSLSRSIAPTFFATHTIPTRYDGMDLDDVAARVGLPRDEVIRVHAAQEYRVLAIGFLPGWAYLGPLSSSLALPRRATPRPRIPAGSVAIMGAQTGIYPRITPGGWHLIGTTDVTLFDVQRERPSLFAPGDRVRFAPA